MSTLLDGFSTTLTFSADASSAVVLAEKEVTPPPLALGEIDQTTMRNVHWRTKSAKALVDVGVATFVAAYETHAYKNIVNMLGTIQVITVHFPDTSTLAFEGWIDSFKPNRLVEGQQPTAEVTIVAGNQATKGGSTTAPTYPAEV